MENVIADAVSHLLQCTDSLEERDLTHPDLIIIQMHSLLILIIKHSFIVYSIILFSLMISLSYLNTLNSIFTKFRISLLQQQQLYLQKYTPFILDGIDLNCHSTILGAPWHIVIPAK